LNYLEEIQDFATDLPAGEPQSPQLINYPSDPHSPEPICLDAMYGFQVIDHGPDQSGSQTQRKMNHLSHAERVNQTAFTERKCEEYGYEKARQGGGLAGLI